MKTITCSDHCAAVHGAELNWFRLLTQTDPLCLVTHTHTHTGYGLPCSWCHAELSYNKLYCVHWSCCCCFLWPTFCFTKDLWLFPLFAPRSVFPLWFISCTTTSLLTALLHWHGNIPTQWTKPDACRLWPVLKPALIQLEYRVSGCRRCAQNQSFLQPTGSTQN